MSLIAPLRPWPLAALLALALAIPAAAQPQPTALRIEGTAFVVTTSDGAELRSPELVGAVLTLAVHGRLHTVRIDAVAPDPIDRNPTGQPADRVWLHTFSMQHADGTWHPVCGPDPEGRRTGFPLAGRTGPGHRLLPAPPGEFEIVCTNGGPGKCARFGYHPWRTTPEGVALRPFYNACILMIRGDYAGTDAPKTRDGMTVDVNDRLGMQPPEFDPALHFEAGWTEEGAVCVAHPRVRENATLAQLEAEIPRLRGRTGAVCTEEFARHHGALILNRSRP
jgi:hypothetical protein